MTPPCWMSWKGRSAASAESLAGKGKHDTRICSAAAVHQLGDLLPGPLDAGPGRFVYRPAGGPPGRTHPAAPGCPLHAGVALAAGRGRRIDCGGDLSAELPV